MQRHGWMLILAIGVAGCGGGGATSKPPTGPTCTPVATTEATCSGGVDDDCDGYPDCLDTECDGQPVRRRPDLQRRRVPRALPARRLLRPRSAGDSERPCHHPR